VTSNRITTGIGGLDALIGGGVPANRAVLLFGEPGTGKTTFGLQFLVEGLTRGEYGVFLSVDEKPQHLIEDAKAFGWDLHAALAKGTLAVLDASAYFTVTRGRTDDPVHVDARLIASDLTHQVRKIHARRLVIDSFTSLVPPDATRWATYDYLRSLIQSLEDNLDCAVLLACRPPHEPDPQGACEAAETLASAVIELQVTKARNGFVRTLFVKKMRGTRLDLAEHVLSIDPQTGLAVGERLSA
jgi:circadian clock protein KaiC